MSAPLGGAVRDRTPGRTTYAGLMLAPAGQIGIKQNCYDHRDDTRTIDMVGNNDPQHEMLAAALRHHRSGELPQAERLYRKILQQTPDHAEALHLLGYLAMQLGNLQAATDLIGRAVSLRPGDAAYVNDLGIVCSQRGDDDAAIHHYEHALTLDPQNFDALNNLGITWKVRRKFVRAIGYFQQALLLKPDFAEGHNNLGNACKEVGQLAIAEQHFREAIRLKQDYANAYVNLGNTLYELNRVDEAKAQYENALHFQPSHADARSCLLYMHAHHVMLDPTGLVDAHREWDRVHGLAGKTHRYTHSVTGAPDKRLRIGYVSPDFCRHPVSYFFAPLLAAHHRDRVEVYCYANVAHPDEVTARLKDSADHWCPTVGMTDAALAKRIHDDRIDILVDLAGHTAGHRLGAFCYQPAPVQVTYLGYCATTGLETMGFWLTDDVIHPSDTIEQAVERIVRLPRCWVAYQPPADAPAVQPRPADAALTLGCFNDRTKVTPQVIAVWSELLHALPGAMLFLKARQYADEQTRTWLIEQFAGRGIDRARLRIEPAGSMAEYLTAYHDIDIALDPFPRTGGVTTADALWMGVPVITLAGQRFIERHSASLLFAVGHGDWVASSIEDYKEKVLTLARDPQRRRQWRATQRDTVAASPLLNADDLANRLEATFRELWKQYLGKA